MKKVGENFKISWPVNVFDYEYDEDLEKAFKIIAKRYREYIDRMILNQIMEEFENDKLRKN